MNGLANNEIDELENKSKMNSINTHQTDDPIQHNYRFNDLKSDI